MNRYLTFSLAIFMTLGTLAIPLRAANKPRAGTHSQNPVVWTNDELEKLHSLGLISIVGQSDREKPMSASVPAGYVKPGTRTGMPGRRRNCAMNLSEDGLTSPAFVKRSKM